MVEGLRSQSVRPLRGLTGEARSGPGVTVAGGPTVQSDTGQQSHPSRAGDVRHGCRIITFAFAVWAAAGTVGLLGVWLFWLTELELDSPWAEIKRASRLSTSSSARSDRWGSGGGGGGRRGAAGAVHRQGG